jgi:hypothetical protein
VDPPTFLVFADSLRVLLAAGDSVHSAFGGYSIGTETFGVLESRLGPRLDRVLVRMPGDSLRLGDILEDFRFYRFLVRSLGPRGFRDELDHALHRVVQGDLLAGVARRRRLDQSAEVRRALAMWADASRAHRLSERIAGEARWTDDDAYLELARYEPERALDLCQVDLQEILRGSEEECRSVLDRLRAGESFDALAAGGTLRTAWASRGGRSGFFPAREHRDLAYQALLSPRDSLRGPLRLPEGWSLFRVLGKRLAPDSLEAPALLGRAREIAADEKRTAEVARHIARLAGREGVRFDYAALRRVRILPQNMLTRRWLGFGGQMLAAPTLAPSWYWVPIWRESRPSLP